MTKKYIGELKIESSNPVKLSYPTASEIPPKKEWFNYSIWEFNGKIYKPVTQKAEANLNEVIDSLRNSGITCCTKKGKIKPSSIQYGIQTYGVEDFTFQ